MFTPPLSRQMACPDCGHEHLWLDCEKCPCTAHTQTGIYPEESPSMTNPVMTIRRDTRGGRALWLWCPGCDDAHRVMVVGEDGSQPPGPCWDWDGNTDAPTISPSLLVRMDFTNNVLPSRACHSFVRAGRWEFLGDCTHALAGQTVDLPPVPDWLYAESKGDVA